MILDSIKDVLYGIDILALIVFCMGLVLFLIFFTFGVYFFKKRFLGGICFFVAFVALFSIPFVLALSSKNFFHKISIVQDNSKPLSYSNSFLIDITFKNEGKFNFDKCLIVIEPQRKKRDLKNRILDFLTPLERYKYKIKDKIKISHEYSIYTILDYNYKEYPYSMSLDCR